MKYIEAPNYDDTNDSLPTLFLGGGITSCKNWQEILIENINKIEGNKHKNVKIYNPRREEFDLTDTSASEIQIKWENHYLNVSDILIFYFSEETLCPITLFELGGALERNLYKPKNQRQRIIVFCELNYKRKFDVEYQISLVMDKASKLHNTDNNPWWFTSTTKDYKDFIDTVIYEIWYANEYKKKTVDILGKL